MNGGVYETKQADCPLCPSADAREVAVFESMGNLGTLKAVQCASCGLVRLSPRRTAVAAAESYRTAASVGHFEKNRGFREAVDEVLLARVERIVPGRGGLLDIGFGAGVLLDVARGRGWQTSGVELTESCCQAAEERGHDVFLGRLGEAPFAEQSLDAIAALYVLEHLHEPLALAKCVYRLLRPGGVFLVVVPNLSCLSHRVACLRGAVAGSSIWDVPSHNFYFTPASLTALCRRAGFSGHAAANLNGYALLRLRPRVAGRWLQALFQTLTCWLPFGSDVTGLFIRGT